MSHRHTTRRRRSALAPALAVTLCLITGPAAWAAQEPASRMPTVEEILRQENRPAPAPTSGPAASPTRPANRPTAPDRPDPATLLKQLPTAGDILARSRKPATISCNRPDPVGVLPDGATATDAEMKVVQAAMKKFVTDGQTFQSCIVLAQAEAWGSLSVSEYLALENLYLQAQALIESEAARFNVQVRAFKSHAATATPPAKAP